MPPDGKCTKRDCRCGCAEQCAFGPRAHCGHHERGCHVKCGAARSR